VGVALLAAAPVCLVIALFGRQVAVLMAGKAFAGAAAIMLWLAIGRAVRMAGPPISAALTALGRPGLSVSANLVSGGALLVILPPMLVWRGLTGAGLHALIQALAGVGLLVFYLWRETRGAPAQPAPSA
jgi:O-antigen/teichoic acid export membrane protein